MKAQTFLSGVAVGGSMLIPGVSGGTMAIILGIYDRLIHSVSTIRTDFRKKAMFLLEFTLGAGAGILLLSKAVLILFEAYEPQMRWLFSGVIAGSLPAIFGKSKIKIKEMSACDRIEGAICILSGLGIAVLLTFIPTGLVRVGGELSVLNLIILSASGLIIAVALVLPGISASHMLLILGVYETVLEAANSLKISVLLPLVISVGAGTLLCTSSIEKAMTKHPRQTYLCIGGFVIASAREIIPTGIDGGFSMVICFILFCIGCMAVSLISGISKNT